MKRYVWAWDRTPPWNNKGRGLTALRRRVREIISAVSPWQWQMRTDCVQGGVHLLAEEMLWFLHLMLGSNVKEGQEVKWTHSHVSLLGLDVVIPWFLTFWRSEESINHLKTSWICLHWTSVKETMHDISGDIHDFLGSIISLITQGVRSKLFLFQIFNVLDVVVGKY